MLWLGANKSTEENETNLINEEGEEVATTSMAADTVVDNKSLGNNVMIVSDNGSGEWMSGRI